jgi:hypothetical protein
VHERLPVEYLKLSVAALNVLKSNDLNYIDEIDVPTLPQLRNMKPSLVQEIKEAVGALSDEGDNGAGAPVPK